ncbi:N-6 DNA methylase [Aequorivita sp. H23M31]|uniref:site-specific DNA-methyltransferase (adenine-specific) n=1 Tax=Aequorivita ciconiae TaxID=2494375 RepID=A0A410G1V4_9FLAO|nr:N-6 DNA methylase [Aequorivita sp. H23M31]QAA81219.1 N-6 DNA methylase [Aequorivita sp. H23M31]
MNILKHESDIWKTADLLIGAGIKQSDFPKFMMPFFALVMVESRLIREAHRLEKEVGKENMDDFIEMFRLEELGYNEFVIRNGKTLKTICKNDKTFDIDFQAYLEAFDGETRGLLGVNKGSGEEKFLDISGVAGLLKKKDILFDTVKAWSEIDLTPFNNSEITTLEEHIKRKWADISAETAGEQYTPEDIIDLITEIITSKIEDNNKFLTIYDPTCGGANLLFGVEDKIQKKFNRPTKTHGDEWNDALYALAKIESRFRNDSEIHHCNTLTAIKHIEKRFDVVVANPPYGVDWKGYQKDIKNDTTERFVALPSISDGQFLLTQHILHHLADDGLSVVVHNGSTLFSGDAGSGESHIRKHFFDQDWVEAIVQMPTDEFFNTGIYTYLWIFNKNKPADRKDKVILIDGSNHWEQLKKSKGKKRRQMNETHRAQIVNAFTDFKDNDFAKVFDKWHFYYNKQAIMLTNVDDQGNAIKMPTKTNRSGETVEAKSIKIDFSTVANLNTFEKEKMKAINKAEITDFNKENYKNLKEYYDAEYKDFVAGFDYKEEAFVVIDKKGNSYTYDTDKSTIIKTDKNQKTSQLGNGKINIKAAYKKATKTKEAAISITVELTKDLEKDYEIIPYSPDKDNNQQTIETFMDQYVTRPFEYLDNVVGVELNFNKEFYKPEELRDIIEIQADLEQLENDLELLEKELAL